VTYWTGHAKSADGEIIKPTVTDRYVKMRKDVAFRAEVAEKIGIGFDLPKTEKVEVAAICSSAPRNAVALAVGNLS
jgi:hypothetical protein